jgi:L-threonylcarbamoyladenylate synthase
MFNQEHVDIIKNDGVGILPTDTLYGIAASSHSKIAVDRLIDIKGMSSERKGFVNLISKVEDLTELGVVLTRAQENILNKAWPGPFSVVLEVDQKHKEILRFKEHPFRIPDNKELVDFISKTGPIITSSANLTGESNAKTIDIAKSYFGDKVDFYINGDELSGDPSTIIKIEKDSVEVIRSGAGDISLLS